MLRPLVKIVLEAGVSYEEFSAICKKLFVDVVITEFSDDRRTINTSRVSALTGISRKQVSKLRSELKAGYSEKGAEVGLNPASVVLHHWYSDPDFCDSDGNPLALRTTGTFPSFADLVGRYAGDIPAGAIKAELERAGAVHVDGSQKLFPRRRYCTPVSLDVDFVKSMAFSLTNLAETLSHNALVKGASLGDRSSAPRTEGYVWSNNLPAAALGEFRQLAAERSTALLKELDEWIGTQEHKKSPAGSRQSEAEPRYCGVGIYYFEGGRSGEPKNARP